MGPLNVRRHDHKDTGRIVSGLRVCVLGALPLAMALTGLTSLWAHTAVLVPVPAPVTVLTWSLAVGTLVVVATVRIRDRKSDQVGREPADAVLLIATTILVNQVSGGIPSVVAASVLAVYGVMFVYLTGTFLRIVVSSPGRAAMVDGSAILPLATAPLAGALFAARHGFAVIALTATAVAAVSWLVVLVSLHVRVHRHPCPAALIPGYAITLSPPALITQSWLTSVGNDIAGTVMIVVVVAFAAGLVARYGKSFRAFLRRREGLSLTFPAAAAATAVSMWVAADQVPGWRVIVWAGALASSVLIGLVVLFRFRDAFHVQRSGVDERLPRTTAHPTSRARFRR